MRKSYRVKKEADFQLVFDQHHSVANKMFIVYTMEREQPTHFRLGISISKKVGLRGHERVWVKRRIRQSVLEFKPNLRQDVDILVIARPSAHDHGDHQEEFGTRLQVGKFVCRSRRKIKTTYYMEKIDAVC